MKEEHYNTLLKGDEGEEYGPAYWNEDTTAHYNFVLQLIHLSPARACAALQQRFARLDPGESHNPAAA